MKDKDFSNYIENDNEIFIVGIGSSAGGLEALKETIPNLPDNLNISYVIVQHLDPNHKSMLVNLLTPSTNMPISEIENNQAILPNRVYITPPDKNVLIRNGLFVLEKTTDPIGPKPSINMFFKSLAVEKQENAVGIILSGTGTDGSAGIREIKMAGGFTIVQEIKTAKFNGMPKSAIDTKSVDFILNPQDIGLKLPEILQFPDISDTLNGEKKGNGIDKIYKIIHDKCGVDFKEYKKNTVIRRIQRHMVSLRLNNLSDYIQTIENDSEILQQLYQGLLISVTSFFRDNESFIALKKELVEYVKKKKKGDSLRIWVPGCATGEEAYSIAILLDSEFGSKLYEYDIQIFGTDLDTKAISIARSGKYPETSLVNLDNEMIEKYFLKENDSFKIIQKIREMVIFSNHDLTQDPPFAHLDLISCRNLLIYFTPTLQSKVFKLFHYGLKENGLLFLGRSENINANPDLFKITGDRKAKVFYKVDSHIGELPNITTRLHRPIISNKDANSVKKQKKSFPEILHNDILNYLKIKAIVVNENMSLIYVLGNLEKYLKVVDGYFESNIINLINDDLRSDLRTALYKCIRENTPQKTRKICIKNDNIKSKEQTVITMNVKVLDTEEEAKLYIVIFNEESTFNDTKNVMIENDGVADTRVAELEQELKSANESQQTTIEELETSNEELQSLTEELQSSNEELQSSNEELETSNEELQSTTEELFTVNEELQVKTSELSSRISDMENIFKILGFGIIVVDHLLRITQFNKKSTELFSLTSGDEGIVITNVPSSISIPGIKSKIQTVINENKNIDFDVFADDKIYWCRFSPYFEDDKITGAILTFHDQTHLRNIESALNSIPDIILRITSDGYIIDYRSNLNNNDIAVSKEEIKGKRISYIKFFKDLEKVFLQFIKATLSNNEVQIYEFERTQNKKVKFFEARFTKNNDNEVFIIIRDITDKKKSEILINDSKKYADSIVSSLKEPLLVLNQSLKVISANPAFYETFNISYDKLIDRHLYEINEKRWANSRINNLLERVTEKNETVYDEELNIEFPVIGKKNLLITIKQLDNALSNDKIILIAIMDVTDRKLAEKAFHDKQVQLAHAGRLASLGEMATGIAHELNQPLSIIRLNAEELQLVIKKNTDFDNKNDNIFSEDLRYIIGGVDRASDIIEQMRGYAHLSDDTTENVNFENIINKSLIFFKAQFKNHQIDLETFIEKDIPTIKFSSQRLEQVIVNFLSNARFAVDKKAERKNNYQKKIRINLKYNSNEKNIYIEIIDNGIGMTKEEKEKCLEPFFSTKQIGEGTGLGLSIVNNILKDMNAELNIFSKKSEGTTMQLIIPVT